jgi:outer membrane protein OmpA-like peptidoglycan-associated protein
MHTKFVGFSLLALAAAAPTAQAQSLGERLEIGAFGQYSKLDDKIKMDNVLGVGGSIAMSVYKWFGVEADVQIGKTNALRSPFEDITYRPARVMGTFTLPITPSKKAALVLGGGYVNSIYAGRASANEYEDGFAAMVGLKLCSSGKWGGRLDGLMNTNPSPNEQELTGTSRNFGARVGVTYALRGNCAAAGQPFDWALKIDPASATVNRGATRQFALSAADMKAAPILLTKVQNLVCTSSDASVATVDNTGKVTAVKAGTATISCKGLVKKLERAATATVTVPPPAWTLTMTPSSGSTDVNKTLSFSAKAVDADNVDLGAVTWSSANSAIASVSNGTVTCNAAGSTTITVTKTAYGSTKTATASVECKALPAARVALDQALFNFDKAIVLKAGQDTLKVVIEAMKRVPSLRISIEGHTDWYGDESYNNTLARNRADAVTKQLLKLAGADAASIKDRIFTSSFGEQCVVVREGDPDPNPPRPRVSSENKSKQSPNRRVEIWQLLGNAGSPTGCRSESERIGRLSFGEIR